MAPEARVYHYLLLVVWLCELDEEDLRREVVYVRDAQGKKRIRELMGNDL